MISKNYFRINDETNIRFNDGLSLYNTNEAMSSILLLKGDMCRTKCNLFRL